MAITNRQYVILSVTLMLCALAPAAESPDDVMYWRPYFGARFADRGGLGIRVTHVAPGSPAEKIGISPGDVIYEFADKNFYKRNINPRQLTDAILLAPIDKPVTVVFLSNAGKKTVSVQLREQPFLGIMFSGHEGQGFFVREIIQNAPAGELGLQRDDLIVGYGANSFKETHLRSRTLADEIASSPFNTPIKLTLLREGRIINKSLIYKNPRAAEQPKKPPAQKPPAEEAEQTPPGDALFSENFDNENKGKGQANYRGFTNWRVTRGEVDLIGNGYFDHQSGNGLYVDMDGSKASWSGATVAGRLTSKKPLTLLPGTYILKFDLAGHPYQGPNTVIVKLADVYRADFTLKRQIPDTGFKTYTRTIKVEKPTTGNLIFEHRGGDFSGLLLDNVSLTRSPDQ